MQFKRPSACYVDADVCAPPQVFLEDEQAEGRYKLIAERPARPAGEALDAIVMQATGQMGAEGEAAPQGLLGQLGGVMRSMQYFMKSLSN
eukprot:359437-Chlamydomonas_euryale.AAC.4